MSRYVGKKKNLSIFLYLLLCNNCNECDNFRNESEKKVISE